MKVAKSNLTTLVYGSYIEIMSKHTRNAPIMDAKHSFGHCKYSPKFLSRFHVSHSVPDCLNEVVMSGNFAGNHRELLPVVPDEDWKHGSNLVLKTGRKLEL